MKNNVTKRLWAWLGTLALACTALQAQEFASQEQEASPPVQITQTDIDQQNRQSAPGAIQKATDTIQEWAEEVRQEFGIEDWGEKDGKIYQFKYASAAEKCLHPDFGRFLDAAFANAMMQIQEAMVMERFGHIVTDRARSFLRDNDRELPPPNQPGYLDKLLALLDKSLDVSQAKLDAELQKLGAPQAQVQGLNQIQKKALFKERLVVEPMKQASGSVAGIFPLQSNVVIDANGNAVVGVVAVLSDKTIQIAQDIAQQRPSLIVGKGRPLKEMLPKNVQQMLGTQGVRLAYDEDGTPVILSYAVSAFVPDGTDDYINDRLRQDARQNAIDTADTQLSEVVNGYLGVETQRQNGAEISRVLEREIKPDALTMEKTTQKALTITRERARLHSSMKLQGVSSLMPPKSFKIPSGQEFFCTVRVWKYSTLRAMQQFNAPKPRIQTPQAQPAKTVQPGSYNGKRINTLEDF
ncbi:MAG: hypothetical protein IJJ33_14755 [Victivallales bacterium]|nr:hypothetical protein [Victivallales bacterium]